MLAPLLGNGADSMVKNDNWPLPSTAEATPCPDALLADLLCLLSIIRQDVAGALQQVVSEEEPPERVLNASAHLHQVLQNVLTGLWEGANVHHAYGDQQIPAGGRKETVGRFSASEL